MNKTEDFIQHLSEKPWSMYTASDYSTEQWHAACLIHQHDGPPTSKSQCKLPIKTPSGAINRNGCYAAAAALAGARGGVNASPEQKAKAAKYLVRWYKEVGKPPPASLMQHSNADVLEHFGVLGMHWGVRNKRPSVSTHPRGQTVIDRPSRKDKKWQKNIYSIHGAVAIHNHVADQMNNGILAKLNSKPEYKNHRMIDKFGEPNQDKISQKYFNEYEKLNREATQRAVSSVHGVSPSGNYRAVLAKNSSGQWQVKIQLANVKHEDVPWEDLIMDVDLDQLGHILKVANIKTSAEHGVTISKDILKHFGVKGMKWGIRNKSRRQIPRKEVKARRARKQASVRRRQISEGDLDAFINRLSKEKKLKDLVDNDLNPGKSAAKRMLSQNGQRIISTVVAGGTLYAIKIGVEKVMSPKGTKVKIDPQEVSKFVTKGGPGKK